MINRLQSDSGARIQVAPGEENSVCWSFFQSSCYYRWFRAQWRETSQYLWNTGGCRVSIIHFNVSLFNVLHRKGKSLVCKVVEDSGGATSLTVSVKTC